MRNKGANSIIRFIYISLGRAAGNFHIYVMHNVHILIINTLTNYALNKIRSEVQNSYELPHVSAPRCRNTWELFWQCSISPCRCLEVYYTSDVFYKVLKLVNVLIQYQWCQKERLSAVHRLWTSSPQWSLQVWGYLAAVQYRPSYLHSQPEGN
jgi:hypothetical protein